MNNVKRVTLVRQSGNSWVCSTGDDNKSALISSKVVEHNNLGAGDSLISAVVPHHSAPRVDYYCVWAHPEDPEKITLELVAEALADLENDKGALLASEIGTEIGDVLYHASLVGKFVYFHNEQPTDSEMDVWYTVNRDGVDIFEVE